MINYRTEENLQENIVHNQEIIYIIGAGAIGKALAVFLTLEGKKVIILRGSIDDRSHFFETIEIETDSETTVSAKVEISTISNYPVLIGLIVLTNKSFGNKSLAEKLKSKITDSPIILLQNGLNVEQPFIDNHFRQIYRCVLFSPVKIILPNCPPKNLLFHHSQSYNQFESGDSKLRSLRRKFVLQRISPESSKSAASNTGK